MIVKKRKAQTKQLFDLPHEVLELIFDQIPYCYLYRMKDIEQIKPYALSRLYSSIFIGNFVKAKASKIQKYYKESHLDNYYEEDYLRFSYGTSYRDNLPRKVHVPEFETVESFVQVVDENRFIRPKKILFGGINTLIELYKSHEELFKSCKIKIIPTEDELENQDFRKLKNIPCNFDEFVGPNYNIFEDTWTFSEEIEWMNRIKRVSISISCIYKEFIGQPFFKNLTGLELERLLPQDAKYIPRSLKELTFHVIDHDIKEVCLYLPNTLESLCIWYPDDWDILDEREELNISCNFEYLTNLKDLSIHFFCPGYNITYGFPASLVSLKFSSIYCGPSERDISVCPNLTTICCHSLEYNFNDTDDYCFSFSNKLKELEVSFNFVRGKAIDKYRNIEELPDRITVEDIFPESLQLLSLGHNNGDIFNFGTDIDTSDGEFLLDLLNLKYLDSFTLVTNKFKIWNLPISLTKLFLHNIHGINFKELKNLMNLVTLDLHHYTDLPVVELDSPNLKSVNLKKSRISKLIPAKLKLPSSVLEIQMCDCRIESIDELFRFPPQLQVLVLNNNELRHPPANLPSNLKVLGLSHNRFKNLETIPSFPKSLKFLDISKSGISRRKFGAELDKLSPILVCNVY